VGLIWLLNLNGHVYDNILSGVWLGVDLRTDTRHEKEIGLRAQNLLPISRAQ